MNFDGNKGNNNPSDKDIVELVDELISEAVEYAREHIKRITSAFAKIISGFTDLTFQVLIGDNCKECFMSSKSKAQSCLLRFASTGTRPALLILFGFIGGTYYVLNLVNVEEVLERALWEIILRYHRQWLVWSEENCVDKKN